MPDFRRPDSGRPDSGRPDSGKPDFGRSSEPSLDEIRRSDSFLDALAGGRPVAPQDAADAELAALLGRWRDETRWPPATGLITESDAAAALAAGRTQRRSGRERWDPDTETTPRRRPRGLSVVGATAAAVLCIGGFGAVVAGSEPGDGLYGLRTMLFGASKQVRDDQVGLAARTQLNQVQDLISRGDWQQAQDKLVEVSTQVASIGDQQQKQDLLEQFNDLSAKVVERDPAATAPPGVVYTVPPSSAALVPAVAPTSTPSAPPLSESTTPTTPTTSMAPSNATTSATTSPTGVPDSSAPSSAAASTPTSAAPSATSAAPPSPTATSEAEPAAQSQPTTTPTSAAPTVTTTVAPQEQAPAAASTSAVPGPTTAPPSSAPAAPAPAQAPPESAPPESAPPESAPAGSAPPPLPDTAVTTTVVPVPVG